MGLLLAVGGAVGPDGQNRNDDKFTDFWMEPSVKSKKKYVFFLNIFLNNSAIYFINNSGQIFTI